MKFKTLLMVVLLAFTFQACKTSKQKQNQIPDMASAVEQTIIYKTVADFSKQVPLLMNEGKTEIISYPHPGDLTYQGKLVLPVLLEGGYLLDNRGISKNVVFTSYTYEEYAALKSAPSLEQLERSIIEKYPLLELYYCGNRSNFKSVGELNKLIKNNFKGCEKADIRVLNIKI